MDGWALNDQEKQAFDRMVGKGTSAESKTSAASAPRQEPSPELGLFKLKEVLANVLRCRAWDGNFEGTTDVYIAKPPLLLQSMTERNGYTFEHTGVQARTSTKTADSTTETQVIVPDYYASTTEGSGDTLYARNAYTGLTYNGWPVYLVDANVDGRIWMKT